MRYLLIMLMLLTAACTGEVRRPLPDAKPAPESRAEPPPKAPENTTAASPDDSVAAATKPEKKPAKGEPEVRQQDGFHAESKRKAIESRYARQVKALYIEQSFRHEARWLNEDLKRDKGLNYQGFFLDADLGWQQPTSLHEAEAGKRPESLRAPFWHAGKLISEEADFLALNYDVIVIGDIDPDATFWHDTYWEWLENWTKAGGGLIFLAGMKFNPSAFKNESAKRLLPVSPEDKQELIDTSILKHFGATDEGFKHGILKLADKSERVRELLGSEQEGKFKRGQLDGLYWYAGNLKPKEGATVLARVVTDGGKVSDGTPVLVCMQHGKGRVVFLGTDDTHRWRQIVGEAYFGRFWQNTIAWAAKAEK